ncbi:hypothetical protein CAPTEDRAFT_221575 [Capitella teleta]|uniref:Uncharacterized protein n=1 Tax=Capitella teleta TaxID=283909 RepID=R7VHY4_CAPTE|nr:hypothetical protein CAPTEDRAFT_221575 [Capitella teleta]|eukprot:ELU15315.1 hypothetical protein CAPTEDRAFT_221575 [Capitella teleta]
MSNLAVEVDSVDSSIELLVAAITLTVAFALDDLVLARCFLEGVLAFAFGICERTKRLKFSKKVNSAPDGDDDFIPQAVQKIQRLQDETKKGKFSKSATEDREGSTKDFKDVVFSKRKNESEYQFKRRMNREVENAIAKSQFEDKFDVNLDQKDNGEMKVEKKKKKEKTEHQIQRKEAKKERLRNIKQNRREKNMTGFEELSDRLSFGEVAMAPPVLTAKPRKAEERDKPGTKDLLLKDVLSGVQRKQVFKQRTVGKTLKRKHMTIAQQRITDKERERAVLMYRQIKERQAQ